MDPNSFVRAVQRMQHLLKVYHAHLEIIAQDAIYSFGVDAQHLRNLLLR
jgi:hypothetical protein